MARRARSSGRTSIASTWTSIARRPHRRRRPASRGRRARWCTSRAVRTQARSCRRSISTARRGGRRSAKARATKSYRATGSIAFEARACARRGRRFASKGRARRLAREDGVVRWGSWAGLTLVIFGEASAARERASASFLVAEVYRSDGLISPEHADDQRPSLIAGGVVGGSWASHRVSSRARILLGGESANDGGGRADGAHSPRGRDAPTMLSGLAPRHVHVPRVFGELLIKNEERVALHLRAALVEHVDFDRLRVAARVRAPRLPRRTTCRCRAF